MKYNFTRITATLITIFSIIGYTPHCISADVSEAQAVPLSFPCIYTMEGYSSVKGTNKLPIGFNVENANRSEHLGLICEQDELYNEVIGSSQSAAPCIVLDETQKTGKLHISFDIKNTDKKARRLILKAYDGRINDNAYSWTLPSDDEEYSISQSSVINVYDNNIVYYENMGSRGITSSVNIDFEKWNKFNLVFDFTTNEAYYYLNGICINDNDPVDISSANGIKAFSLRADIPTDDMITEYYGYSAETAEFEHQKKTLYLNYEMLLLDNVYVNKYSGDSDNLYFSASKKNNIKVSDGKVAVTLSEPIDTAMITKSNISVVKKDAVTGEDYTLSDIMPNGFVINFNTLEYGGEYEIKLSENIKGKINNSISLNSVKFYAENQFVLDSDINQLAYMSFGSNEMSENLSVSSNVKADSFGLKMYEKVRYIDSSNITSFAADTENSYADFEISNIDTAGKRINYFLDIEYYDFSFTCFAIKYTTVDGNTAYSENIYCMQENEIKKCTVKLENPDFSKSVDFSIVINRNNEQLYSVKNVPEYLYIKSVSLYTDYTSSDALISVTTDRTGNIFFEEPAVFSITVDNLLNTTLNFDIRYRIEQIKPDINIVHINTSESEGLGNGKKLVKSINFTPPEYGLYELSVEIVGTGASTAYVAKKIKFSSSRKSEIKNSELGSCVHLVRFGDADKEMSLLRNAGFGSFRDDFTWWEYEKDSKGNTGLSERHINLIDKSNDYEIEPLLILYGNNALYDNTIPDVKKDNVGWSMPHDDLISEFKNYLRSILSEDKLQNIKIIELWNEPQALHYINGDDVKNDYVRKGEQYAKILNAANEVITDIKRTDIKIGAFSLCGMNAESCKTFLRSSLNYIKNNYPDKKLYDYVTVHPYFEDANSEEGYYGYLTDSNPVITDIGQLIDDYRQIIKECGGDADIPIWFTEYGYQSSPKSGEEKAVEMTQAKKLIRKYITLDAYNDSQKEKSRTWFYDLADDSQHFGLVHHRDDAVPYAAKYSYIAVSAMNDIISDTNLCESVYLASNNRIYKYSGDKKEVYVIWNDNDEISYINDFLINGKGLKYYDFLGNEISENTVKTSAGYMTDSVPYYIVKDVNEINLQVFVNRNEKNIPLSEAGPIKSGDDLIMDILYNGIPDNTMPDKVLAAMGLYVSGVLYSKNYDILEFEPNTENYYQNSVNIRVPVLKNGEMAECKTYIWNYDTLAPLK